MNITLKNKLRVHARNIKTYSGYIRPNGAPPKFLKTIANLIKEK